MSFLQIPLQDFLVFPGLFVIIVISALYLYSFFNTPHSASNLPVNIVEDKNITESSIKNANINQTQQQSVSFHPDLIPDEIKKIGLISYLREKHKNGQRIVTDLLSINTISVIDPITIKSSFHIGNRSKNKYRFLEPIWGQDNLYVLSADRAKVYRNLFDPVLSSDVIANKFCDIINFGAKIVDKWEEGILLRNENVVRIQDQGLEFSLKATIKLLFSADFPKNFDLVEYKKIYHDVISRLYNREFCSTSDARDERIQTSINYLFQVLRIFLNEKRNNADIIMRRTQRDLLDILISEKDPETNQNFDDDKIKNIMSLFLTIGFLSTGVSISCVIFYIAKSLKTQEEIQNEIDRLLNGRLPSYQDLLNLTYLNQVVKESLTKRPPFPILSRCLPKNENLKTLRDPLLNLQKDTVLLYPIALSEDADCPLDAHCPFGFGNRICPAENMAMIEIQLMVCLIMQRFKVKSYIPDIKVSGEENIISMARNDIYIELIPRSEIKK